MYYKMKVSHPEPNTNKTKGTSKLHELVARISSSLSNPNCCTQAPPSAHTSGSIWIVVWAGEGKNLCLVYRWFDSVCRHKLKIDSNHVTATLKTGFGRVVRECPQQWESFRWYTWSPTLCDKISGLKLDCICNHRQQWLPDHLFS